VESKSKVLDLGCSSGHLLDILTKEKEALGRGIEISEEGVRKCVKRGLSVLQGDIDDGLSDYPHGSFDYVILNQTISYLKKPLFLLKEAVRVGKKLIVSFPNFGHYSSRYSLFFGGKVPREWRKENLYLFTIKDFEKICRKNNYQILEKTFYSHNGKDSRFFPNLFAQNAIYVLKK
jgi:methionine biosynthesis protein MetW